jgi:hypothetical protein
MRLCNMSLVTQESLRPALLLIDFGCLVLDNDEAMTIQVKLGPETEARLAAEAEARGIPLESCAVALLDEVLASRASGSGKLTVDEVQRMLREIAEGSESLPHLPTSAFTRESFYEDRH